MDFQMRNLVLMEPETGEIVQIAYLCDADLSEQVFDKYSLRELGTANNQMFFQLGIYPVSIYYEKAGKVIRTRENTFEKEFDCISDNTYRVNTSRLKPRAFEKKRPA